MLTWTCIAIRLVAVITWVCYYARAQMVSPPSITLQAASPLCGGGNSTASTPVTVPNVCLTLPPDSITKKVDVFLLLDDTGSFNTYSLAIGEIFAEIVAALEQHLPQVDFGFGVGHFEDFFFGNQPFALDQKIITVAQAGSASARNALIQSALNKTYPGNGGDAPESNIEALYRAVTGLPSFLTPAGGATFRPNALKLIMLATDSCTVAPFDGPVPDVIVGTGSTEPVTAFACAGNQRFGQVGTVAPLDAATVPATVAALNNLGVRVIGLGPDLGPTSSVDPTLEASTFLSALARLTGAVDETGQPLVFNITGGSDPIFSAIVSAIVTTSTLPVDVELTVKDSSGVQVVSTSPLVVDAVAPGDRACFNVTLSAFTNTTNLDQAANLVFQDLASSARLGIIPARLFCSDCVSAITGFTLLDSDLAMELGSFPKTLDYASSLAMRMNVRADYKSCSDKPIDSVLMLYKNSTNETKLCERFTPYSVFGDFNPGGPDLGPVGPFNPFRFPIENNQRINSIPYTTPSCNAGKRVLSRSAKFNVVNTATCPGKVLSFVLWGAETKFPERIIRDNAVFCPNTNNYTIEARVLPCQNQTLGSVRFQYALPNATLADFSIEKRDTYFLFGDFKGVIKGGGRLANGDYKIKATPYSKLNGRGLRGTALTVAFTVAC